MTAPFKRRVLIVDDERDLVDALVLRLTVLGGFDVETANDGETGLAKCQLFRPDVILLDISLPGIHGWEFCRRLRQEPRTRDIPVVIMTAWVPESLKKQIKEARAVYFLVKPFDEKELVDVLRLVAAPVSAGRRHLGL